VVIFRDHGSGDVDAGEVGGEGGEGAGDHAGAAGVIEDADRGFLGRRGGAGDAEPVAAGAEFGGDLGGGALHPGLGVVGCCGFAVGG